MLVLAVIALGAAGAAIGTGGEGGSSSAGLGEGEGVGGGPSQGGPLGMEVEIIPLIPGGWIPLVLGIIAVSGFVYAVVKLVLTILARDWAELKRFLVEAGQKIGIIVLIAVAAWLLFGLFDGSSGGGSTGILGGGESEGAGGSSSDTGIQLPGLVGIAVVAAVVLFIAFLSLRRRGEDEETAPQPTIEPDTGGAVTGGGSERVTAAVPTTPADNDVYRAWLDLVDAAGVSATRRTPAEVAERAVEAGVDEDATREITDLFEAVRYGPGDPGSEDERRAREARRRLGGPT